MRFRRLAMAAGVLGAVLTGTDASAGSPGLTFITIDYPEAAWTYAFGINDQGTIVGQYCTISGGYDCHAYMRRRDGALSKIVGPDGLVLEAAVGINSGGEIVGVLGDGCSFLLSGGTFTRFCVPDSMTTHATGINQQGDIVGVYSSASGPHGFLLRDGVFTTIDCPDGQTTLRGVNAVGTVVGNCYFGSEHPYGLSFVWRDGAFTEIAFPDADFTEALGINDRGDVVGDYGFGYWDTAQAFLLRNGQFTPLGLPASNSDARGINNRGQIVGGYRDLTSSDPHGFRATVR